MTQPVPEMMTLLLEIGEQSSQLWLSQPDGAPSHYPLAFGTHAIQPDRFATRRPPRSNWSGPSWWWRMS